MCQNNLTIIMEVILVDALRQNRNDTIKNCLLLRDNRQESAMRRATKIINQVDWVNIL